MLQTSGDQEQEAVSAWDWWLVHWGRTLDAGDKAAAETSEPLLEARNHHPLPPGIHQPSHPIPAQPPPPPGEDATLATVTAVWPRSGEVLSPEQQAKLRELLLEYRNSSDTS
ncbi:hypothetical protein EOD39_19303 [Acipenser ruthenus]|uniref:Uncharacterized protein n=1 Tax=Acipenser ruthenus TaxID=7906 RepID=A0A444UYK7_ACIRT|nr:hypothetical protein EOD39_19303 [Acipenser ruthenus]